MTRPERVTRALIAVLLVAGGMAMLARHHAEGAIPLMLGALIAGDMP